MWKNLEPSDVAEGMGFKSIGEVVPTRGKPYQKRRFHALRRDSYSRWTKSRTPSTSTPSCVRPAYRTAIQAKP